MTLIDLSALQTEGLNPRSAAIDRISTLDLCRLINEEDATVAGVVAKCIPVIADAIDALAPRIRRGGRLIYVGAGTSGRLGVVDASEIPPTYSAPHGQFVALMAGGDAAMRVAQEGAEDNYEAAALDLAPLNLDPERDSLIGIAASGRTPYVLGAMDYAKKLGCITIGLACADPSAMSTAPGLADFMITAVTGPEVVTGSTRMKAGTATKLILNMLSTGIMIKIGKTYGNMMVDLKASNLKLEQRSRNIIRKLAGPSCPSSDAEIDALLVACNGSVKLALATLALGSTPDEAREKLEAAGGKLASILQSSTTDPPVSNGTLSAEQSSTTPTPRLVMYIDGGASKCAATVIASDGRVGEGEAGPCNATDRGVDQAVTSIKLAAQRALDSLSTSAGASPKSVVNLDNAPFTAIWIGLAGHDRPGVAAKLAPALREIFRVADGGMFKLGNDIDVLATAGTRGEVDTEEAEEDPAETAIVLIAGTGSVCMRYTRDPEVGASEFSRSGRSGGWGHLLGDEGGGYDLGRQAIRATLHALDELRIAQASASPSPQLTESSLDSLPTLARRVLDHFGPAPATNYDLLSEVLTSKSGDVDTKTKIAQVARLVLEVAATEKPRKHSVNGDIIDHDTSPRALLGNGVAGLIRTLRPLLREPFSADKATLVLAGSLLTSENGIYRTTLLAELERMGIRFRAVKVVKSPAWLGARHLAQKHLGLKLAE